MHLLLYSCLACVCHCPRYSQKAGSQGKLTSQICLLKQRLRKNYIWNFLVCMVQGLEAMLFSRFSNDSTDLNKLLAHSSKSYAQVCWNADIPNPSLILVCSSSAGSCVLSMLTTPSFPGRMRWYQRRKLQLSESMMPLSDINSGFAMKAKRERSMEYRIEQSG